MIKRFKAINKEYYFTDDIILRMAIKRSKETLKALKEIWDLVNPLHSDTISKEVYCRMSNVLVQEFGRGMKATNIAYDMRLDFQYNNGLVF